MEEEVYNNVMASSNSSKVAFNSISLEIIKDVNVNDKEISVLRNKLCQLLWEWQLEKTKYLKKNKVNKEDLYSFKIYSLIDRIYKRCYLHTNPSPENTVCGIILDTCLFSSWMIYSIESFYLGKLPKFFTSDAFDVTFDFIKDISRKCSKRHDNFEHLIISATKHLKNKYPMSNNEPLGPPVTKEEILEVLKHA